MGALEGWYLLPRSRGSKAWVPLGRQQRTQKPKKPLPRSGKEVLAWGPKETQGLSMRLNSTGSEGSANCFGS
jgi:hypothetical protein